MTLTDASVVSELSGQLGYPMTESVIEGRISKILTMDQHALFVAEVDSTVVGWAHIYIAEILEAENSYVEINGLVVDESLRGHGIGKALIERSEEWARKRDIVDIRVRSSIKRTEAHGFYKKLGFEIVKTQHRFAKKL